MDTNEILFRQLLLNLGENPEREGLQRTPQRMARAMEYMTQGYRQSPDEVVGNAIFHEECNHIVVVRDIEVYSLCEHHLLPFYGHCHIGYLPQGQILGVSKLARLVDCFARRLQVQERLTQQIAQYIMGKVNAAGVGVVMECHHLCMMMRGVEKQDAAMLTTSMLGSFSTSESLRSEFYQLIGRSGH